MSHPAEGLLRRALDEPAAIDDATRRHVDSCPDCRAELADAAADRDAVAVSLEPALAAAPDVDAAWRRLTAHAGERAAGVPIAAPPARRAARSRLRRPAVAVAAAAAIVVGSTAAAAANDWLPIFKPKQVTAVNVDLQDVSAMPDLSAYGDLSVPDAEPEQVATAAEAQARSGIEVPRVAKLPDGVTGQPQYGVMNRTTARFTFSAAKARAAAERSGRALPAMPEGVDGSALQVVGGPGVAEIWGAEQGIPELAVVRMVAPTASSQGVSLPTLRDYLLAQPGIPKDVADQLRRLPDDGSVLPVPVPSRYATTEPVTVGGVRGTAIELRDGSAAGVVWIAGGRLNLVIGSVDLDDVVSVARGLR